MPKYIKKCTRCSQEFSQDIDPNNFDVKSFCENCRTKLKIKTISCSPICGYDKNCSKCLSS